MGDLQRLGTSSPTRLKLPVMIKRPAAIRAREDGPRRPNKPFRAPKVIVDMDHRRFLETFVPVLFSFVPLPRSGMSGVTEPPRSRQSAVVSAPTFVVGRTSLSPP